MRDWHALLQPAIMIAFILLVAQLLRWLLARLLRRSNLPQNVRVLARRLGSFLILGSAGLMALDVFGVSATVLWAAFTSFAAVGAVAFFAAWSVLSNIFCSFLILTTRSFRVGDLVEVLENGEKPGLRGRVVDVNLIYTTLQESEGRASGTVLQVPNSLFFQRIVRRWRGELPPLPAEVARQGAATGSKG
ncbi:MAG: mechanosensitive ion channel family protein [Gammaproteobacteria bacterium]|nr:mechanosensitive ion channel family protein [Gammaproteobacteria bacterium]